MSMDRRFLIGGMAAVGASGAFAKTSKAGREKRRR